MPITPEKTNTSRHEPIASSAPAKIGPSAAPAAEQPK